MSDQVKRVRSPNYPAVSLGQAISQLQPLFERINKHAAPKEAIVKGLGYGGWNGASAAVVSAHTKYGLLERDGELFKVTDRAMRIMFPKDATERQAALREAALAPSLYTELVEEYGETPPHDDILVPWLIRRGFAPTAVTGVIQGFRDTMSLVQPIGADYDSASLEGKQMGQQGVTVISGSITPPSPPPITQPPLVPSGGRQEKIADDDGNQIVLTFPAEPTIETYEFVKEYLEFRIARLQKASARITLEDLM
jgi:hypothetical protein